MSNDLKRRMDLGYDLLLERGMVALEAQTAAQMEAFQIDEADWDVDLAAGLIRFASPRGVMAVAEVQVIGTYNEVDETWLWGWANPTLAEGLTVHARQVQAYGAQYDEDALTMNSFNCDEALCWEFVTIAYYLNGAQGVYCGQAGDNLLIFFTFGEVMMEKSEV
ncbi:MAG TPA: hypothetical protein VLL52_14325 [Anaerolineae bacterium]|nr:hypothetical protein [Anaerolineae bacterium]